MATELVFHMSRLAGVDNRVLQFFLFWHRKGPFALTIPPTGGVRTNELVQYELYSKGRTVPGPGVGTPGAPPLGYTVTNAKSLAETPHGYPNNAAADAIPAVVVQGKVVAVLDNVKDPKTLALVTEYGELAEKHGLVWGGRFKNFFDGFHVETPDWRAKGNSNG